MKRSLKQVSRLKPRLRLKMVIYLVTFSFALSLGVSFFIVQFLRNETGDAADNPMVFSDITVSQDTSPVFKGTINQVVLCMRITTRGVSNKLSLNSLELSSRGTSPEASQEIKNARLWYTGSDDYFTTNRQLGATLQEIPGGNFTVNTQALLQDGNNYFWLTFDIPDNRQLQNQVIDAECISARIGTLQYFPPRSAPPGSRVLFQNKPFYSTGNGDISSLASWNTRRDGSGSNPVSFSDASATFHIQSGHVMWNNLSACIPGIIVERGGVLRSASEIRSAMIDIQNGGSFFQDKEFADPFAIKKFLIRNNGTYIHNNPGPVPGKEKNIEPHSSILITNPGDKTFAESFHTGNVIIDARMAKQTDFQNFLNYVSGDLEIRSTGDSYLFTSVSDTIRIGGNLVLNGGKIVFTPARNHLVLILAKNLVIKNGSLCDVNPAQQMDGSLELISGGSVVINGGKLHLTGKNSSITFTGGNHYWVQQLVQDITLPNILVPENSCLTVNGEYMGELGPGTKMEIRKNSRLSCGNAVISGSGNLVIAEGATLCTSHAEGIHSAGSNGAIQTSGRTFSSFANYEFTGGISPQSSGEFETQPMPETVNDLVISKSSLMDVLVLKQNFNVRGMLVKNRGNINKNSYTISKLKAGSDISGLP